MAADTKAHIYGLDRLDTIHRLHRSMAGLAGNMIVDVDAMAEAHERREYVHSVPSNFERRVVSILPWSRDWLNLAPVQ
jgi:hypothetical protein